MIRRRLVPALVVALVPGALSAQATVFRGPPGGVGDVWVHPAPQAAATRPPELQGILLLPLDFAGRTEFERFLPDRPRRETDVPSAARIVLPNGHGVLYRYRRTTAQGADFGLFRVRTDGLAEPLASFPGTGPGGTDDPIPAPLAIAPDGGTLLVATTVAAGGDLVEIELASGALRTRTTALPPLDLVPEGLMLLETWGVALARDGALRFTRPDGEARFVALVPRSARADLGHNPGAPLAAPFPYAAEGIVRSADGSTVALVAGRSSAEAHVYAFGSSGPATCVNDLPAPITGAGFGTSSAPWLALSDDGSRVAWKTLDALGGECFSRRVPVLATPIEQHLTGDAAFDDTLNDTGVISFFDPDSVVVLVGEPQLAGGVEGGDLYRVRFPLGGGAPVYSNLTRTSGDTAAPFLEQGEIETTEGLFRVPGGHGAVYYLDLSSNEGQIHRFNAASGAIQILRTGIDELELVESAGTSLVYGFQYDDPGQRELLRIPFDFAQPAETLGLVPSSTQFGASAGSASGVFAVSLTSLAGARLVQTLLGSGTGELLPLVPAVGPVLGFDGSGALLASLQGGGRTWFVGWALGSGLALYGSASVPGVVLPGR